jgi:sporulation and spore germination protein
MTRALILSTALLLVAVLALGFYLVHLKKSAEQRPALADQPVTAPVSMPAQLVTLYVADDEQAALLQRRVSIALPKEAQARSRELLRALIAEYLKSDSHHALGAGADVTDVLIVNNSTAVVNVNATFADKHRSGVLVEELTLASMAQTLGANVSGIGKLKLVVDGKERETLAGHADLMSLYDVNVARELVKEQ